MTRFWIIGVLSSVVGVLGLIGNTLSLIVLCKRFTSINIIIMMDSLYSWGSGFNPTFVLVNLESFHPKHQMAVKKTLHVQNYPHCGYGHIVGLSLIEEFSALIRARITFRGEKIVILDYFQSNSPSRIA